MRRLRFALAVPFLVVVFALCTFGADSDVVRIGIVTDVHVHDTDSPVEGKVMVNYTERLASFVDAMSAWPADVVIELGDLVNGAFILGGAPGDSSRIGGFLEQAVALLSAFDGPIHYVAGNHDFYDLSKAEFLATTGAEATVYSFDLGAYHIVVLDAEYNSDGTDYDHVFLRVKGLIPQEQLDWLAADLAAATLPVIICAHQQIDSEFDPLAGGPPIENNHDVQRVLRESGNVIAVFQGHEHANIYAEIDGIHYVTFEAMVDHTEPGPPTWAQVTLDPEARTITIEGFGLQISLDLAY